MPKTSLGTICKRAALACLLCGLSSVAALAQAPTPVGAPDLNALFNKAIDSFTRGQYQVAIDTIATLVQNLPKDLEPKAMEKMNADLEPVYFTLGASQFNLKRYPEAASALNEYVKRYPKGQRVNDALFSLAQAHYFTKEFEEAAKAFAALENIPSYREQATFLEAVSYKEVPSLDKAIAAMEKLTKGGIKSSTSARGAMQLVRWYGEKKQPEKALKILTDIESNIGQVENIVEFNNIALLQGDAFLAAEPTPANAEALICYRVVRTKAEVVALQKDRIAALNARAEGIKNTMRAAGQAAGQYVIPLRQVQTVLEENQKLLDEFEKQPSIRPKLLYRIGRAFSGLGKPWEAVVAYNDALTIGKNSSDVTDREPPLFALITANIDINQAVEARALCDRYLKEFPNGPNVSTVGYLQGFSALQEGDAEKAAGYFGHILETQPASTMREELRFLLGNALFSQGKFDEAEKTYRQYQNDYPKGAHEDEAFYRLALCSVFGGKYDEALKRIDEYLQKFGEGAQAKSDAKYRRAVCQYANQDYPEVVKACDAWLKEFSMTNEQSGEVLALRADANVALSGIEKDGAAAAAKTDAALNDYQRSFKAATTDEVRNYSLFEANKILQKKGEWDKIAAMFQDFIKDRPDDPTAVMAAYWIGRAKTKEGKADEAKRYIADQIGKYIDNPRRDAVEQLIDQLATMCMRKKKPAADTTAAASPTPPPSASPAAAPASDLAASAAPASSPVSDLAASAAPVVTPAAPVDPGIELDELLGAAKPDRTPTAKARILYAKSQLARMRRQPAEIDRNLALIAALYKPEVLSPVILGQVGDSLVAKGKFDEAAPFYEHLLEYYGKSDVIDYAYAGLGEIAFQKKQYDKALGFFKDGTDKIVANTKMKEITVGQAKTLLELSKFDESKKLFETAASVREWRGETTAYSVYSLGQIESRQGNWAKANAYYQRVYVAYQKFLPWVAKAYLGSGETFEKLGKTPEAIRTYQEMIRNEKLADFPETTTARQRLLALGATS